MDEIEVDAIKKLRTGILIGVIIPIVLWIPLIYFAIAAGVIFSFTNLQSSLSGIISTNQASPPTTLSQLLGIGIISLVLLAIVIILGLVGILRIRNSFNTLQKMGKDIGMGKTGSTLALVSEITYIVGLGFILLMAVMANNISPPLTTVMVIDGLMFIAIIILSISSLIILLGGIFIGDGIYAIGDIYNDSLTRLGGIFVTVIILAFVGYILTFVGSARIVRNLTSKAPPRIQQPSYNPQLTIPQSVPPQHGTQQPSYSVQSMSPNPQPMIYQLGLGILGKDGYARFKLYSTTTAMLAFGTIEGVNLQSSYIMPVALQIGENMITMGFGDVSNLIPGTQYIINLIVNIGGSVQNVKVSVTYQP